ncbi:kinase-like protein [Polyporus arcularius HHB13444]|uniref:Kinase-like protein n=1 Tax=Polyporus arcularius HHB13444 TaxID=1314778 RepID=A0A5C3P2S2_9APHY|nr:kinase-like protein [Polyporus arcularius HHB13444]
MSSKLNLSLDEVHQLLRTSSVQLDDRPYDRGDFAIPRRIEAIEKDGVRLIVRYGYHVSPIEAETTAFVAQRTSVRVPTIHAVFSEYREDSGQTVTYIVEERLPRTTLLEALPTLDDHARQVLTSELRTIFSQLAALSSHRDRLGPLRGPWHKGNAKFTWLLDRYPCGENDARETRSFIQYWVNIIGRNSLTSHRVSDRLFEPYDFSRPPAFSHGDLKPTNVMVHEGHVVGIIDWAEAGWYPYFWDAYILHKSLHQLWAMFSIWEPMASQLGDPYMPEAKAMFRLLTLVEDAS